MVRRSIFFQSAYSKKIKATTKPQGNDVPYDYLPNSGNQINLYVRQDMFVFFVYLML